jgi:hypothetical protein
VLVGARKGQHGGSTEAPAAVLSVGLTEQERPLEVKETMVREIAAPAATTERTGARIRWRRL